MRRPTQRALTRADVESLLGETVLDAAELSGGGFAAVWRATLADRIAHSSGSAANHITSQRSPCQTPCARIVPSWTNPARRATATESSFPATIVRKTRAAPTSNSQRVSRIAARVA